jgi:hypothetical protein
LKRRDSTSWRFPLAFLANKRRKVAMNPDFDSHVTRADKKPTPKGGSFLLLNMNWKRELGFAAFESIPLWVLPVPQGTPMA